MKTTDFIDEDIKISEYNLKRRYKKLSIKQDGYGGWGVKSHDKTSDGDFIVGLDTKEECQQWINQYSLLKSKLPKD